MLRDILRNDPQAVAVAQVIAQVQADILVLQGIDYDLEGHGLSALVSLITQAGLSYPHSFTAQPNSGLSTGLDMNGDGYRGGPRDSQGFGKFMGHRGMAVLSRWPIDSDGIRNMSGLLWADMPSADLPRWPDGRPFPSVEAQAIQRLSSVGHWQVPILLPTDGRLNILAFHATPPVFDGEEDQNGLRNAAEISFWRHFLDGVFGPPPRSPFVIAGIANTDPARTGAEHDAIRALIADPRLQDPRPVSAMHGTHTVNWPEPDPGDMRASYVLPSVDLTVVASGVFWPRPRVRMH